MPIDDLGGVPATKPRHGADRTEPTLDAKRRYLASAAAHPGLPGVVECIETHMSCVFLAGDRVFKLKKPVRFPFLDFSTTGGREFYCREELRLNARLAPDVYLGLLALQVLDDDAGDGTCSAESVGAAAGRPREGGAEADAGGSEPHGWRFALVPEHRLPAPGRTVDWLVLMRRLPAQRALHTLIAQGGVQPPDVAALVRVLASFYGRAAKCSLPAATYVAHFQREQAANREVLLRPQFALRGAARALEALDAALLAQATPLGERAAGGHVVEGHGDLRPEHVWLLPTPVVIDCLEFNAALRQVDPFDELAFLALECEMAGAPWIGAQLLAGCTAALTNRPDAALMNLYTAHRALLRARLAMAHLLDPQPRTPAEWAPRAQRYVDRALSALNGTSLTAAP
jgi:aminoglycoside phosphotransferase family enzyme